MDCAVVEADPGAVGEAFPAEAADKGPLSCVDAGVDLQSTRLGETFPTLAAAVGFLSRVGPLMGPDPGQVRKPPAAEAAGVRPLSRVNAPVDLQGPGLAETLPAVGAGVGPGAGVHVEVDAEVAVRVEGPAALRAQEARRFVRVLGALVLQQLGRSGERGGAVHAGVQRQHVRPAPLLGLLALSVLLLVVVALLGTGGQRVRAGQAGERAGELWSVRARELRAGQARGDGTVVVVEVVVRVGVGERGVRALLLAQDLGAGLEAAMATQAGKHGEVGQGRSGGRSVRVVVRAPSPSARLLLPLRSAGRPGLQLRRHGGAAAAAARLRVRKVVA